MKRPRSHQLEDISKIALRAALPSAWVLREKSHDYGMDGEFEVFDDNDMSTGLIAAYQIKATDKTEKIPPIYLQRRSLDYLKSLSTPVLLIRYISSDDELYCRWIHSIFPIGGEKTQQVKVEFSELDRWQNTTATRIKRELEIFKHLIPDRSDAPLPIRIITRSRVIGNLAVSVLLAHLISNFNRVDGLLQLVESDVLPALQITIDRDSIKAQIGEYSSYEIIGHEKLNTKEIPGVIASDCLVATAAALTKAGRHILESF
jgi:hypothetical protein